jgi:predicted RNA binding protein YcfA (HicA-like mRNA interferase family)
LKSISGKEFSRLLERHGWELKRVRGNHHIFAKSGNPARISVPIHGNSPLKVGLLLHFLKMSGIDEREL